MRVEYVRDGLIEEFHNGYFERYPFSQSVRNSYPYFLRSCAKPLQASLLLDYGADLTDKELALCSGSHAGEDCHIETARELLKKYGLDENFLRCGVHKPLSKTKQANMLLNGEEAFQIHNNCSGKHIGFLILCKINGWDIDTYYELEHPLQQKIKEKIYSMCEVSDSDGYPLTTDGCGVPIVSMPLENMLKGYYNLLSYERIVNSILSNPYIFGGEDRLDTEIIQNTKGLIAKVGAGGLCIVFNVTKKEGFVIKIDDCSMEARRFAVWEAINSLGWGDYNTDKLIKTISGKVVGEVNVVL